MTADSDEVGRQPEPEAPGRATRLTVPEMDCPSCARKVDNSLARVEGVLEATVQPTTGTVTVTYDPDLATDGDVVRAIRRAGYDVAEQVDPGASESASPQIAPSSTVWGGSRARKTAFGAVFLTLGLVFEFALAAQNPGLTTILEYPLSLADLFFLVAIAASGTPILRAGFYSATQRSLDIDLLMGTAIVAATAIGYFVEAATLAVLFSVAQLLETYAMDRARDSLRELMELSPDEATVRREGSAVVVPAADVAVGETVIVRPGEKVPLDGTVMDGKSAVDESPITGESVPVDKQPGDQVYAGSITEAGYLEFAVDAPAAESTLARIIDLVQDAQETKTDHEQFVDRFAGYYTPAVVLLAILTATLPPLLLGGPTTVTVAGFAHTVDAQWQVWFVRGLTLLVIACPCAFVISTPVSVVSGLTSAAKHGVLIKGGTHLEAMGEVSVVAFDKTGTLTTGELAVTDVLALGTASEDEVLGYAAAIERRSEHPIGEAIVAAAEEATVDGLPPLRDFESITGEGVRAVIGEETYYVGKPGLFEGLGVDLSAVQARSDGGTAIEGSTADRQGAKSSDRDVGAISRLTGEGKTVVLVGTGTQLLGLIAVADEVRPGAAESVARLRDLGVDRVVMLTGDNEGTARAIAAAVGVDEYRAGLLPEEKVDAVTDLQTAAGAVAMVGDGINDAPALATADVGIAMGAAGTDTALETADIALMGDEIGRLPYLHGLSNAADGVIRQNIWSSLGVKVLLALGVPLGLVSVALAVVVGDMGMSLGVTGNAMRLARLSPDQFVEG